MVKVLPTTFTLFERQNIINASAEPLCTHCSEEYVFIACDGSLIEVYNLATTEKVAKLRTIWPVANIAYNSHGDCILTLERRTTDSPATARMYFKWRGIIDEEKPTKVIYMGSLSHTTPSETHMTTNVDAEIMELPVENCSCISICDLTGVVAVGSEKVVYMFALKREPTATLSTSGYKLTSMIDIRTDMKLRNIYICGNYIACISTHRVRVLKFLILGSDDHPWAELQSYSHSMDRLQQKKTRDDEICQTDENFISWSPSYVWEVETRSAPIKKVESHRGDVSPCVRNDTASPLMLINDEDIELDVETESDQKSDVTKTRTSLSVIKSSVEVPNVATITLPAITHAISEARKDGGKHELEVLGPVEFVWGQPLSLELHDELGDGVRCRVLTMLYRRFPSTGYAYVHVSSEGRPRSMTEKRSSTLPHVKSSGGGMGRYKGGLHSIKLVPTLAEGEKQLVGMACILANRSKGFVYDVFKKTQLVNSVSFMSRCQTVCYDGSFLHTLSTEAVDSYTSRVTASVMSRQRFTSGFVDMAEKKKGAWLHQPCPSSSLELTLISSNKFIGCCELVSSPSHIVVLCKHGDGSPPLHSAAESTGKSSFLHSLSFRRVKPSSRGSWNIYVLEKKSTVAMFTQFIDSAMSLGEGSPPVLQHHLSEAHLLLRPLAIQYEATSDVVKLLRENCFQLADSLCVYSPDKKSLTNAAGYFVLSGRPIVEVIQHIISKHAEGESRIPFTILLNYLNLVLFEEDNISTQLDSVSPLANQILELYTKYDCDRLPEFILFSWLKDYSKQKALELLQILLPKASHHPMKQTYDLMNLAITYLHCELGQLDEAVQILSTLNNSFLHSWVLKNPEFSMDIENSILKPFGKVLMNGFEQHFLSLISTMLCNGSLSWYSMCQILQVNDQAVLLSNQMLKQLLEDIVENKIVLDSTVTSNATMLLTEVLYTRVLSDSPTKSSSFIKFTHRHMWLNKLPPFENSLDDNTDSVLYTSMSKSCLRDLMELQSLLCSDHMTQDLASHVNHMISQSNIGDNPTSNIAVISLQLLVWPFLDKIMEGTRRLLDTYPSIVVEYCKIYYKSCLDKWKILLDELLQRIKTCQPAEKNIMRFVYQDTLFHIVTLTSPEEFLYLLPPDGNPSFFLQSIEQSCKLYLAREISAHLHSIEGVSN